MKITTDNKQRISAAIAFILEFYKTVMATFLIIIIPQDCNGDICPFTTNLFKNNWYYIFGNSFNLLTFIIILYFYLIELKRENWSITYLDINHNKSHNNLDLEVENYPQIKNKLLKINHSYLKIIKISIIILIINN